MEGGVACSGRWLFWRGELIWWSVAVLEVERGRFCGVVGCCSWSWRRRGPFEGGGGVADHGGGYFSE